MTAEQKHKEAMQLWAFKMNLAQGVAVAVASDFALNLHPAEGIYTARDIEGAVLGCSQFAIAVAETIVESMKPPAESNQSLVTQ